ncbi:MAG TPA: hypothetical protein VJK00_01605, partial [Steroidobacteraceae bacterium]|nr:hypothetical protein [Steroidobacteraceae bacterium]
MQYAHLLDETCRQHRVEATIEPLVELIAGKRHEGVRRKTQAGGCYAPLPVADRLAGQFEYLQRPLDALPVGRLDTRGGRWIDAGKLRMQRRPAVAARTRVESSSQRGIGWRK